MSKLTRVRQPLPTTGRFMIGRDDQGRWTVTDDKGMVGASFLDRASAIHFALTQSHHAPGAVQCLPDDTTIAVDPLFHVGRKPVSQPAGRRL